ncbi:hypothetical protein BDR04DRAFT_1093393 [Suillus decipiens]|nr:hypothetical protein BDR04DRAFT_1093393 [Suillus decipiens]
MCWHLQSRRKRDVGEQRLLRTWGYFHRCHEGEAHLNLPEIPIIQIVKHPVISSLTNYVNALPSKDSQTKARKYVSLQLSGNKMPIFFVHPGVGKVIIFVNLAKYFQNERPFYALHPRGFEPGHPFFTSMDERCCATLQQSRGGRRRDHMLSQGTVMVVLSRLKSQ